MKRNKGITICALVLVSIQFGCLKKPDITPETPTDNRPITTILKNNYAFSMLYTALQRTGLDKTLEGNGPFTLLAPDNDAFGRAGISPDSLAKVNADVLKKLISYHIIKASIPYSAIPQSIDFQFQTLAGPVVYFSVPIPGDQQFQNLNAKIAHINGVLAKKVDIKAANGYIIVLNKSLYYPAPTVKSILESNPDYSFFVKALKKFGLFDQLDKTGPFVVMAPKNNAFLQSGIDETAIDALDTINYKKILFNAYLLPSYRFFTTDLNDAPLGRQSPPGIITPDYIQVMQQGDDYTPANFGLYSLNYKFIQVYALPPYYGNAFIYGQPVAISDPDHQALNGVLNGIDGVVMLPDSAKIH